MSVPKIAFCVVEVPVVVEHGHVDEAECDAQPRLDGLMLLLDPLPLSHVADDREQPLLAALRVAEHGHVRLDANLLAGAEHVDVLSPPVSQLGERRLRRALALGRRPAPAVHVAQRLPERIPGRNPVELLRPTVPVDDELAPVDGHDGAPDLGEDPRLEMQALVSRPPGERGRLGGPGLVGASHEGPRVRRTQSS